MGYNPKLTGNLFKWFCENNKEEIEACRHGSWNSIAIFKDGTKVTTINSTSHIRGERFDQLILCDDERWEIYGKRYDDISLLRFNCMFITNVPDEFQILEYLYDKNVDE
jgi:hypothetical protein